MSLQGLVLAVRLAHQARLAVAQPLDMQPCQMESEADHILALQLQASPATFHNYGPGWNTQGPVSVRR